MTLETVCAGTETASDSDVSAIERESIDGLGLEGVGETVPSFISGDASDVAESFDALLAEEPKRDEKGLRRDAELATGLPIGKLEIDEALEPARPLEELLDAFCFTSAGNGRL